MDYCKGSVPLFIVLTVILTSMCQAGASNPFPPWDKNDVACDSTTVQWGSTGYLVFKLGENPYLYSGFHLYLEHEGKTVYSEDCFLKNGHTKKTCKKMLHSSGIQTEGVLSDTLTLLILNATGQFGGQYEVRLFLGSRSHQGTCSVIVGYPEKNNSTYSRHADEDTVTTSASTSTTTKEAIPMSSIVVVLIALIFIS